MMSGGPRRGADERVEAFIRASGVDESAAAAFRNEPPEIIESVIDAGIKSFCRNPSSMLMSLIKKAREQHAGGDDRRRPPARRRTPLDDFINEYQLDERAQEELRNAPEDVIRRIVDGGPITAKNPSSCVMAMLRKGGRPERRPSMADLDRYIAESGIDSHAAESLRRQHEDVIFTILEEGVPNGWNNSALIMRRIRDLSDGRPGPPDQGRPGPPDHGRPGPPDRRSPGRPGGSPRRGAPRVDLRTFLRENRVDPEAEEFLRSQSREVIDAVLEQGNLAGRNTSSMLVHRVKLVLQGEAGRQDHRGERRPLSRDRRADSRERRVDRRGELHRSRDPRDGRRDFDRDAARHNGRAASPLRREHHGERQDYDRRPAPPPKPAERHPEGRLQRDVEAFIAAGNLDSKASEVLRAQRPNVLDAILTEGVPMGRNPSALVMARIKQLTNGQEESARSEPPRKPREGPDLEAYVRECRLDKHAAASVFSQSEAVQRVLLGEPWPREMRNPSSYVMKRIRDVVGEGRRPAAPEGEGQGKPVSKRVCWHYRRGRCNYGGKCAFRHEGPVDLTAETAAEEPFPDTPVGHRERELSSALEELQQAAWDTGLPQEDFEAMMRRVSDAREELLDALEVAAAVEAAEATAGGALGEDGAPGVAIGDMGEAGGDADADATKEPPAKRPRPSTAADAA